MNKTKEIKLLSRIYAKALLSASILLLLASLNGCGSGPCDYPDDRAKDGSRCGDRAASVRPGGRNPDFNKLLMGLLVVGGVVGFIALVGNSSSGSNNRPSKTTQSSPTLNVASQSKIDRPKINKFNSQSKEQIPSLGNIERILWEEFDYKIDPMFIETFKEVASSCRQQNYTASDGAILYMLAIISMVMPSQSDESMKQFVRKHLSKCEEVLPRGNLPKQETASHLSTLRSYFD